MIKLNVKNETDRLVSVILGSGNNCGGIPQLEDCIDPKSIENVKNGTFPVEKDIVKEINNLARVFKSYKINVFRPENIKGLNQIFSRDVAFVIDSKFCIANVIWNRIEEFNGIKHILNQIPLNSIVKIPFDVRIEGGDVMLCDKYVFVGYSEKEDFKKYKVARTNKEGVEFLKINFPNKKIKEFELNKSDNNPKVNALHLDCCFQPIGKKMAIIYDKGFKNKSDLEFLEHYFGNDNIIRISEEEMYNMHSNIFSISPEIIITGKGFTRLNNELTTRGFKVEEVAYAEIAKMGGLFRCSTIPLLRK